MLHRRPVILYLLSDAILSRQATSYPYDPRHHATTFYSEPAVHRLVSRANAALCIPPIRITAVSDAQNRFAEVAGF